MTHSALHDLEVAAYRLASGRGPQPDPIALVRALDGRGPLLRILRDTAPRIFESEAARRQFFHAARALVALHRA
jgi:hypothetical protein